MKRRIEGWSVLAVCLIGAGPLAFADDTNQATSQDQASSQNHGGAHGTMDEAITRATIALGNLAEMNIPGAISNGYKAWGHYQNHNQLQDLESRTNGLSNVMISAASVAAAGTAGVGSGTSSNGASDVTGAQSETLTNMGHERMYDGPLASALADAEKKTGLKREDLLKAADMFASDLSRTDLSLEDQNQLIQRHYDRFAQALPNKELGARLLQIEAMLPLPMRLSILSHMNKQRDESNEAIAARGAAARRVAGTGPVTASPLAAGPIAPAPEAGASAASARDTIAEAPAAAAAVSEALPKLDDRPSFFGVTGKAENVLGSLLNGKEEDVSLFARVTVRYRALTPMLQPDPASPVVPVASLR